MSSCPSGEYTALNTRKVVVEGKFDSDGLWACVTCYQCQERCPRGIAIVDHIISLRNEAAKAGKMLEKHRAVALKFLEKGESVPWDDKSGEMRKAIGMEMKPPTVAKYKDALEEVRLLMKLTGFEELIDLGKE